MKPGAVYAATLGQMAVAAHFAPGHRLRLEIAGTNFPEYERNLHTGGENSSATSGRTARVRVLHDNGHASYVELPVMR